MTNNDLVPPDVWLPFTDIIDLLLILLFYEKLFFLHFVVLSYCSGSLKQETHILIKYLLCFFFKGPTKSCCTQYHDKPIPLRALKIYTIQEITGFCNIKAVM